MRRGSRGRSACVRRRWRRHIGADRGSRRSAARSRSSRPWSARREDHRRRRDHLRDRGEVEPVIARSAARLGHAARPCRRAAPRVVPSAVTSRASRRECGPAATAAAAGAKARSICVIDHARSSGRRGLRVDDDRQQHDRREAHRARHAEEAVIADLLLDHARPRPRAAAAAGRRSPTGRHIARPG